jgi:hypothetical protein
LVGEALEDFFSSLGGEIGDFFGDLLDDLCFFC